MEPLTKEKKAGLEGPARPSEAPKPMNGGFGYSGRSTPFGTPAAPDRLNELGPPKVMHRYGGSKGT